VKRRFAQVDVFTEVAFAGNPLAAVIYGNGLIDVEMQRFANWTNLSESTFLLPPIHPDADYRIRIFTASTELPFAGDPTLGTCHAFLANGGEASGLILSFRNVQQD
jgi:PhzF family phenazine biosynthesis protein